MERVIVEREFDVPVDLGELVERAKRNALCYELRHVKHVRTVVSNDGRRMICEYDAPDAESVREANDLAGVPYVRVWTARRIE
ncbi:nickel-binding protein [Sandaracinus amylolyticus]|uniref:DUF4242 domain-containing protein n=1 Tax=Sandaracinus amylolyticus TaxID=927083 RepID=A0A0F6W983_9BACT|nr:nickel-binding protein [Sandaracinus amylolyticus]AKF10700.1 hypothetical protein DB32_007849 [Sandaracinus amylolyticus]